MFLKGVSSALHEPFLCWSKHNCIMRMMPGTYRENLNTIFNIAKSQNHTLERIRKSHATLRIWLRAFVCEGEDWKIQIQNIFLYNLFIYLVIFNYVLLFQRERAQCVLVSCNFNMELDLQSLGSSPDLQRWLIRARQIQWSKLGIWTWDISLTP